MGYTFIIGEAEFYDPDDGETDLRVTAKYVVEAPASPQTDMGFGNILSPPYGDWQDFCLDVGLLPLFYGKEVAKRQPPTKHIFTPYRQDYILQEHPGAVALEEGDLICVERALKMANMARGNKIQVTSAEKQYLVRLEWLCFWVRWALENCKQPVIANS